MAKIKINNARLSFPSLFKKSAFEEGKEGKYEATFIVPKGKGHLFIDGKDVGYDGVIAMIEAGIKDAKLGKVPSDKRFIKDGDEHFDLDKYPEYAGHWIIKAANNKRPTTIDREKVAVVEEDELFYAGCYVNGIVEPWYQNNSYGKRVNSNLLGVQFVKDGEPFGDAQVASTDEFDEIDEDEEF